MTLNSRSARRYTRAGRPHLANASGQATVGSLQQAGIGELVEVERGEGARQAGRRGCLLAAHRLVLPGHPVVEPAARRLVQQAKRGEVVSSGIDHAADSNTHAR